MGEAGFNDLSVVSAFDIVTIHPFVQLYTATGVAHGDGHAGNVMAAGVTGECIDFECSFLPISTFEPTTIIGTIHSHYEIRG